MFRVRVFFIFYFFLLNISSSVLSTELYDIHYIDSIHSKQLCVVLHFTNIAKLGDSASFFSLYVGGTPLYLRTEIYQISSIFGHVLKKAMVLAITEKNNVKINLRSLLNGKYTY